MNTFLFLFMVAGVSLVILFTLTWVIQLRTRNAAIVDTVWAASFPLVVMIYFFLADGYAVRQWLVLATVTGWGFRLASYLYVRTMGEPEDARYTTLRKQWGSKQDILMLRFYYFQALLVVMLSLPFALIMVNTTQALNYFEFAGASIWLIAVMGESAADAQLKKFKGDPANKGRICNTGLWHYSRHPNYFFEWLVWVAYFVMALGSPWGLTSVLCPLAMYYFLTKVTGIAYTEAQMLKSKGSAFEEYQKTTPAFFPWPKKISNQPSPETSAKN